MKMRWNDPHYYEDLIFGTKKDRKKAEELIKKGKIRIRKEFGKYFKEYYIEKKKEKKEE